MLLPVGLLVLGGVLLYYGAEWFVRGAAGLAIRLGVPPLLIGLTVVSYATSAPELAVSMLAAAEGKSQIALGNVIGSNIANIGLILGLTAVIAPPRTDGTLITKELVVLILGTLALPLLLVSGHIERYEGALNTIASVLFTVLVIRWSKSRGSQENAEVPDPGRHRATVLSALLALGLAVLLGGGKLFVDGAVGVAQALGMSDRTIGLTVVAFGTSVPELAASLIAAVKGHSEIAVGNVVGSSIFNLLFILGATSLVFPIAGTLGDLAIDLATMAFLTLLMSIALRAERIIRRWEGVIMLLTYAAFVTWVVMAPSS
jgi:cation:H+ antiporter